MIPAIEVAGLSFAFETGRDVLADLSFRINPGERIAILGGNGAGKSTLVWCLADILPARGEVRIFGEKPASARSRLGVVFQNPEDQLFMPSIQEDLILPLVNRGISEEEALEKARGLLDRVGLLDLAIRPAAKLSFGQRKRAAIVATLISGPEILLLDEPTAELDGRSVRELRVLLASLHCTLILVTHDLGFARDLTDRALLLSSGRLLASCPTTSIPDGLLESTGIL